MIAPSPLSSSAPVMITLVKELQGCLVSARDAYLLLIFCSFSSLPRVSLFIYAVFHVFPSPALSPPTTYVSPVPSPLPLYMVRLLVYCVYRSAV